MNHTTMVGIIGTVAGAVFGAVGPLAGIVLGAVVGGGLCALAAAEEGKS